MAWQDYIKVAGLDTAKLPIAGEYGTPRGLRRARADDPPPEPDPSPCPPVFFELFVGAGAAAAESTPAEGSLEAILGEIRDEIKIVADSYRISDEDSQGMKDWLEEFKKINPKFATWLEKLDDVPPPPEPDPDAEERGIRRARGEDLPAVPNLPAVPSLPDLAQYVSLPALIARFGVWGLPIYAAIQIGYPIIAELLRKKLLPTPVENIQALVERIAVALEELQSIDASIEMPGGMKAYVRNKIVSYPHEE